VNDQGWRKSTRSGTQGNNCVEARVTTRGFQVRDSKLSDESPVFGLGAEDFTALLSRAKAS
jgi:hypothetical protein